MGRLLLTILLCAEKLLSQPLLYLSAFFEHHRQEYYRLLLGVSRSGNWNDWVSFFLRGVCEQSRDAVNRSSRLLDLRQEYRGKLQSARASALLLQLIDELFLYPAITVATAAARLAITPRTAQLNIDKLVEAEILREATGRQRNRVFVAPDIVRIIEAREAG